MFPWDYPKPVFSKRDWYSSWVLAGVGGVEDNGAAVGLQDHASAAGGEGIAGVIAVEVVFKAAQGHLEIAQALVRKPEASWEGSWSKYSNEVTLP